MRVDSSVGLPLALKPGKLFGVRAVAKRLDRALSIGAAVLRSIHPSEPSGAQLAEEEVAVDDSPHPPTLRT
jgi:hypothetical protein